MANLRKTNILCECKEENQLHREKNNYNFKNNYNLKFIYNF